MNFSRIALHRLRVLLAVWNALFLREASARMFGSRAAWVWLVAEPVINILWLILVFTAIRVRHIGGIETALWIASGMLVFMTFKRTLTQVQNAVDSNSALFAYRQVRPADVALVRAGCEGFSMLIISFSLFAVGMLMGWMAFPDSAWAVFQGFFLAWLCALGLGLIFGVLVKLIPEMDRIINFIMMPLMMMSGVIFPLNMVPLPYQAWLMWNPLAHAIEVTRLGFASYYHATPGLNLNYGYFCGLTLVFFGIALFRRFNQRLVMQ